MKKRNFGMLVLGVLGGLLFALGMCMCLLPEWNAFQPGLLCAALGVVALLILLGLWRTGREKVKVDWKTVGKVLYGVLGALVLGTGMCLIMVWEQLIWGIVVGIAGIALLLGLIPMIRGLHD